MYTYPDNLMSMDSFNKAISLFDASNAEDPNRTYVGAVAYPKELLYAQRMTKQLMVFAPDASEVVQLAARSQHIQRWKIPRTTYPMNRSGYKRWRVALLAFHAQVAGALMGQAGYGPDVIERVQTLLTKKRLKRDAEVQLLEDVICLVFLEHYFSDFAAKHDEEKLEGILKKTWAKMSTQGHKAATSLSLPDATLNLINRALED